MKFTELKIKGAYLIELETINDFRGSFIRQFCQKELAQYGLDFKIQQCNISKNLKKRYSSQDVLSETSIFGKKIVVTDATGLIVTEVIPFFEKENFYILALSSQNCNLLDKQDIDNILTPITRFIRVLMKYFLKNTGVVYEK